MSKLLAVLVAMGLLLGCVPAASAAGRAKCIITFDDGFKSAATAAKPILDANGQRGVSFVIPSRVGYGSYMNVSQLQALYAGGWDVSSHTMTHPNLNHLPASALEYEVNGAYAWLLAMGFTRSAGYMAYPFGYGYNNATVLAKVAEHNAFGRTTQTGEYRAQLAPTLPLNCTVRGFELYNVTLVSEVTAQIDSAIAEGGLLVLCLHTVLVNGTELNRYSTSTADLKAVSDYLASQPIDVVTFSNLAPVAPPPPPPPVVKSYKIVLVDAEGGAYKVSSTRLGAGVYSVPVGKTVYFAVTPAPGYKFSHWICLTDYNGDGSGWDKTTRYYRNPQYFMSTSTNRLFQLTPVYVKLA